MESAEYIQSVRDQYDVYPYPPRNPEDEAMRLENCWHDFLELINFYCFRGGNNFSGPFRVLVAGGGTGDQTIFMAEQLRFNRSAEIVHVDISAHAMEIARRRADVRRLTNITWVHNSILGLPSLQLGHFDYITCEGVLHHLKDPAAGLRALNAVLKEDGAMMIMLYGKYGRTGVYHMQELMRRFNAGEEDMQVKIENTKTVLECLPKTNWFKRGEDLIGDHKELGDTGVVDVFLHPQDRAYTVDEVYELVEGCGLQLIELIDQGRSKYMVESYIRHPGLLEKIGRLPPRQQQAIAELVGGDLTSHNFYVARDADRIARLDDLKNVPFYFLTSPGDISDWMEKHPGQAISVKSTLYQSPLEIRPGKYIKHIFKHLDGERSLKEIFEEVRKDVALSERQLTNDDLLKEFKPAYERFNAVGWMLLRHRSVGPFRSLSQMQQSV
jgi:SAM-dependent methyltransferase